MRISHIILFLIPVFHSCSALRHDKEIESELKELDRCIQVRKLLEEEKLVRIKGLKASLDDRSSSPESRLSTVGRLTHEYNTYCFDSLVFWLERQIALADELANRNTASMARIRLASALASGGYYLESNEVFSKIDTSGFTNELYREYWHAMYIFADNLEENSEPLCSYRLVGSRSGYLEKSLLYGDPGSSLWKFYRMRLYMLKHSYAKADKAADELLAFFPKGSGDYAFTASYKSVICDSLHRDRDRLIWLIRSAQSDMLCLNKNYSALTMVASDLAVKDPARAFRYISMSLDDGLAFSGILRPWQISRLLPDIQAAFMQKELGVKRQIHLLNIIFIALIIILAVSLYIIYCYYRSLSRMRTELMEANNVREQYIAQFLVRQSDWIDRLKSFQLSIIKKIRFGKTDEVVRELSMSDDVDREIKIFHEDFDNTFLALFPTFIDEFNELLKEDARIIPPASGNGGKAMNTELRIYALVRLGIDDSNEIARLLKYSVRTIYNYKVKILNSAKVDREIFEKAVKNIGKRQNAQGNHSTF